MTQQKNKLFDSYLDSYNFILSSLERNRINSAYAEMIMLNNKEIELYIDHISGQKILDDVDRDVPDWEQVIEVFANSQIII